MDNSQWIDIGELPHTGGFSKLYTDYVTDFRKVQPFFETDYRSIQNFTNCVDHVKQRMDHRPLLVEVLTEQNQRFGATERAIENIRQLSEENTFAVVTGQQVGMLGGPLYTIYKIATAIKLTNELNTAFPRYKFVPIFWLEGEDHDFEEVNKVSLLNAEHVPTKVEYLLNGKPTTRNVGPVGELVLNGYLGTFFENLSKTLGNSEFKQQLLEFLRQSYKPNATLNQAFASLMGRFFETDGLVFISSNDKRLKQLLSPIFLKEIQEIPRTSQLIIQQSAELEERYHAQVKPKALNLFYFYKGGRYFIEPRETDFTLKGTRYFIQKEELLRVAVENPELLSPNVALRPICQDTLLPTIAYVAGPSEIAYFAQLKGAYRNFGITMPVIYPRATATILEEKHEKTMEKYQLDIMDFFGNPELLNRKVVELVSEIKIDELFEDTARRINDQLNEMKFGLNYIDPTLLGALETARTKIEYQISSLKEKTAEAQNRKHEIALRQVERVAHSVYPNQEFQERELNIVHFMNKHGLEFAKWLQGEIQIGQFQHQIIRV